MFNHPFRATMAHQLTPADLKAKNDHLKQQIVDCEAMSAASKPPANARKLKDEEEACD